MWKDINGYFADIFWVSRSKAGIFIWILFIFLLVVAVKFGIEVSNVILWALIGLFALFVVFVAVRIIVLFLKTK